MSNATDWLRSREADFFKLCGKWQVGLNDTANKTAFGWKQAETALTWAAISAYLKAREDYEKDNSTANRVTKDNNKETAKTAMRNFANTSIRFNSLMSAADKLVYGVKEPSNSHEADKPPASYPEADGDTSTMRQIKIHFWDSVTKKRGKPHRVHGAEFRWAILDHAPSSVDELINSDFDTRSPFILKFDESQRGQRVYFCLRWETNTNLKGPFGEIYSAIIP